MLNLLTLEIIPVVVTYWRQEQLLLGPAERALGRHGSEVSRRALARTATLARGNLGFNLVQLFTARASEICAAVEVPSEWETTRATELALLRRSQTVT